MTVRIEILLAAGRLKLMESPSSSRSQPFETTNDADKGGTGTLATKGG
jgi:hypothetical protein